MKKTMLLILFALCLSQLSVYADQMDLLIANRLILFSKAQYYTAHCTDLSSMKFKGLAGDIKELGDTSQYIYTVESECRFLFLEVYSLELLRQNKPEALRLALSPMDVIADYGNEKENDPFYKVSTSVLSIMNLVNARQFSEAQKSLNNLSTLVKPFGLKEDQEYIANISAAIKDKNTNASLTITQDRMKALLGEQLDYIGRIMTDTHEMLAVATKQELQSLDSLIQNRDSDGIVKLLLKLRARIRK